MATTMGMAGIQKKFFAKLAGVAIALWSTLYVGVSLRAGEIDVPVSSTDVEGAGFDPFGSVGDGYRALSSYAVLYERESNPILQSVALTGLYNEQWYSASGEGGDDADWDHRAFWLGSKLRLFDSTTFRVRFDVNASPGVDGGRLIETLEDTALTWKPDKDLAIIIGKFKPRITQEFNTARQKLLTFERSLLVNQVRTEKVGGAEIRGNMGTYSFRTGIFLGALTEDWDIPDFSGGVGGSLSVGKEITEQSEVRLDYFVHDGDTGNSGFSDYRHVVSLNSTSQWQQIGLATDVIYGSGLGEVADVGGLIVMPWYDLTEKVRIVGRYQLSGANADDGIRLQRRYERAVASTETERGDLYQAAYLGVNYRIDGDNLKLMSGIEYSHLDGRSDFDGWTLFTGIRLYF